MALSARPAEASPEFTSPAPTGTRWRAALIAAAAAGVGAGVLRALPGLELGLFARGAAALAGFFLGVPSVRLDTGWLLPTTGVSSVVTRACSATDYFIVVAAFLTWWSARRGGSAGRALVLGLAAALPLTLAINAARVVAVTQAHRWFIPRLPDAYGPFLHLLTGVLVFLPSLVALSLLLESHERSRCASRR